jgi:hypothetical protein
MIINDKRALAYTVLVDEIREIPGYDRVEHARVGGWWIIVAKADNIKPGDMCVYFEVDSKVPATDERFAFLEKRNYKIKTLKMCKVFSQGLLMPIALFPELGANPEIHTDVTDTLGIKYAVDEDNERKAAKVNKDKKYQSMAARHAKLFKKPFFRWLMRREWGRKLLFVFFGKKKDNPRGWPTHFPYIHKTDEERVENLPWVLGYERPLIVTEKLDGTSSTYILERKGKNKYEFYVLSRNVRQADENQACYHDHNIYWDMAFKYNIETKLREYMEKYPLLTYVCVQGESVGSVQGNPLKLTEDDFYVFNFIDSLNGRWASTAAREIVEEMGMQFVPILDNEFMMPTDMEEFKQMATAPSVVNPNVMREGIVLRDPTNDFSFKNVSREYLMKHNG